MENTFVIKDIAVDNTHAALVVLAACFVATDVFDAFDDQGGLRGSLEKLAEDGRAVDMKALKVIPTFFMRI